MSLQIGKRRTVAVKVPELARVLQWSQFKGSVCMIWCGLKTSTGNVNGLLPLCRELDVPGNQVVLESLPICLFTFIK